MKLRIRFFVVFLLCLLMGQSCSDESKNNIDDLFGNWVMKSAMRNGKAIATLDNAYFIFQRDSIMSTNILGGDFESSFKYNEENGSIFSSAMQGHDMVYIIRHLSKDSLSLSTNIRSYNFDFNLGRESEE